MVSLKQTLLNAVGLLLRVVPALTAADRHVPGTTTVTLLCGHEQIWYGRPRPRRSTVLVAAEFDVLARSAEGAKALKLEGGHLVGAPAEEGAVTSAPSPVGTVHPGNGRGLTLDGARMTDPSCRSVLPSWKQSPAKPLANNAM